MRAFVVVCLLSTLGGGVLAACPIRSRVVVSTPVVKKVVVAEVATVIPVAVYQPLAIAVPTYTAAYSPPVATAPAQPAQSAQPAGGELRQIIDALKALDARLQRLEKGTLPAPKPADPFNPPKTGALKGGKDGLALAVSRCAVCHDSKVAAKDGGGLTLFEAGKLAPGLTDRQRLKATTAVRKNTMPPASNAKGVKQLADDEADLVSDAFAK